MIEIKKRLRSGESILGTMINVFDNIDIVRIFKEAGFDLIVIDNEHGHIDYNKTSDMLNLARALKIGGLVRIPELKRGVVHKYMEMGADGILMPNCKTKEQAKKLIEYSKYSPLGNRGVSLFRTHSGYE
jgi:2-dehydro-3-deoxyglucarate aldolase/4-hydroxy-2-oxoheptanedioate aldolase